MGTLIKYGITAVVSAAGGAVALKKKQVGGTYVKFWKKEFWAGKPKAEHNRSDAESN